MSNPSGPDQDATPEPEETPAGDDPQAQAEEAAQATEEAQQPTEETTDEEPAPEEPAPEEPAPEESAEAPAEPPEGPSEAPTEVITASEPEPEPEFESAEPTVVLEGVDDAADLRYSAPSGFDVKPTEIMQSPARAGHRGHVGPRRSTETGCAAGDSTTTAKRADTVAGHWCWR